MSIASAKDKRIAARRPRYLQRLVRLFRWESWDTSLNLHLIPTVTFWRHHSDDDWDEDCLLCVRREVRIGVEWLFWNKSWRVWHREWRDEEARERFTDDANAALTGAEGVRVEGTVMPRED